ncbi:MAG: starch synthase [Desulforhopalus sp.]
MAGKDGFVSCVIGSFVGSKMVAQKNPVKNIWMLSREYGSLAGAGGVKDVVHQLSKSLARWSGRSVHVVLPLYGFMSAGSMGFRAVEDPLLPGQKLQLAIDMSLPGEQVLESVSFYSNRLERVNVYLVDAVRFSDKKSVYTYTKEEESGKSWQKASVGHHDYFAMNVLLQKSALEFMIALNEKPDVIHCHDGHTALTSALIHETPGYRSYFRGTGCLTTIHNAGYGYHQEVADIPYAHSITGLSEETLARNQLEDKFDPLLVAGAFGLVNTVSENYAAELQKSQNDQMTGWLGHEFGNRGILLEGITNGIDPEEFSALDEKIPENCRFNPGSLKDDLRGKRLFKENFVEEVTNFCSFDGVEQFGFLRSMADAPLYTFIGRLSGQKGVDLLLEVLPVFLVQNNAVTVVVLGSGEGELESGLMDLAQEERFSGRVCYLKGFSSELAEKVYCAGDYFIIPSRFEPCGLTDFIAQLYGNIPIAHHVGGLVKVVDGVTGLAYKGNDPGDLLGALERALALEGEPSRKRQIQINAVETIEKRYTWSKVMHSYMDLYARSRMRQLEHLHPTE